MPSLPPLAHGIPHSQAKASSSTPSRQSLYPGRTDLSGEPAFPCSSSASESPPRTSLSANLHGALEPKGQDPHSEPWRTLVGAASSAMPSPLSSA